jgi:phosphate transport system substrate-binding protein
MKKLTIALALAALALAGPVHAAETSGAGSTFVYPVMTRWAADYAAKTGNKITYKSIGSGLGVTEIKKGVVDFGASDMPLKPNELAKFGIGQFPLVIGGVVPVVHIAGVKPGEMRFTGRLLADIFLGKVKRWDDPAVQTINPGLKLPDTPITVVHRTDGSGTTFNWSNYLSKASSEWKASVSEGATVEWPIGLGGKGNEGVASLVDLTPGSIGYVEYAYALQNRDTIAFGLVQNKTGNFVSPNAESFKAAAANADWMTTKDFYLIMTDAPGEQSYPIAATVFILMYKQPKSPERAAVALEFFRWVLENGQTQAESLDYVPLPPDVVQQIEVYWRAQFAGIKD